MMIHTSKFITVGLTWWLSAFMMISPVVSSEENRELGYYGYDNDVPQGKGSSGGGCNGPLTYFESNVLVDFDGFDDDPSDLTRINWDRLEKAFMDSYNALAADLCDDSATRVVDVTIDVGSDGEILKKRSGCEYTLSYTVQATCRGCDPHSATLFSAPGKGGYYRQLISANGEMTSDESALNDVIQKRRRMPNYYESKGSKGSKGEGKGKGKGSKGSGGDDDYYGKGKGKGSKGSGGDDDYYGKGGSYPGPPGGDCDCNSKYPQYRTPTEEEFRVAYDAAISAFGNTPQPHRRGGVAVDYVTHVMEVADVGECSNAVEEFNALVSIEFFGDREAVTDEERAVLEENFIWIYNWLQAERCDSPIFRSANLAEIILVSDPDEPQVFLYVFFVSGTCRGVGCSTDLELFSSDSFLRRLDHAVGYNGHHDTCQCPIYTTQFGAPTTSEFEVRYFQSIQCEKEKGRLVNIDASGEVTELGPDFTPFPTDSPVVGPPISLPPGQTAAPTRPGGTTAPTRPGETNAPTTDRSIPPASLAPGQTAAPTLAQHQHLLIFLQFHYPQQEH